jgi:hypothetical protein
VGGMSECEDMEYQNDWGWLDDLYERKYIPSLMNRRFNKEPLTDDENKALDSFITARNKHGC